MNERQIKRYIKESVTHQGGICFNMSGAYTSGIPDLYIIMHGHTPILAEVKQLGEVKQWPRQIPYTARQRMALRELGKINPHSACGLVGFSSTETTTGKAGQFLMLVPYYVDIITGTDRWPLAFKYRTPHFDINYLLNRLKTLEFESE